MTELDTFTTAYIEAALWSSTDDEGEPLDCGDHELAPETRERMIADCERFQRENAVLLRHARADDYNGHDFWLTRCGHGAGYWDRDLGKVGEKLTVAAEDFGGVELYVGDDGMIYGA